MCEIIVLDPEQNSFETIMAIAVKFNDEQGDGLGILAVNDTGEQYEYEHYKSVYPDWNTFNQFLERTVDDTWRYIIHGRAMTAGDVNRQNAHPIHVDCSECEFNWVIHNGSVRRHTSKRGGLSSQGHTFNTPVDSEVIAHVVSELPGDLDGHDSNTYNLYGNLNYILCSPNGIIVRTSRRYSVTDDFTMTCSLQMFEDYEQHGFDREKTTQFLLARPGEDIETAGYSSTSSWNGSSRSGTSRASTTTQTTHAGWGGMQGNPNNQWNRIDEEDYAGEGSEDGESVGANQRPDRFTVDYRDHCDNYEWMVAIQVAPDVIRVLDTDSGKEQYFYRDRDPKLFYWYAPEETPENVDELQEIAEQHGRLPQDYDPQQVSKDDYAVEDEIAQASAETVVNMTLDEAASISDDLLEMMAETSNEQSA